MNRLIILGQTQRQGKYMRDGGSLLHLENMDSFYETGPGLPARATVV
jgi:hypothetical protein